MSALSNYSEKALLDHLLVATTATPAATYYVGLFTADPGESGVTSEVTLGVGAYARASVANNVVNFPPCAITGTPTKSNATVITFPTATAAWGTITHWAIYDDDGSPAGNMIAHGSLGASHIIQTGKTVKILAGAMVFTLTNATKGGLTDYTKRALLDLWFGGVTFTAPANVYLGAGTALTGDTLTEWTESTYVRSQTAFTAATLGAGTCPNTSNEELTAASADAAAVLTHYGIWDDATSGNLLIVGQLESSKTVNTGDSFSFPAGSVVASLL